MHWFDYMRGYEEGNYDVKFNKSGEIMPYL
ncbi:MAG: hypothetical protein JWP81_596 [Ferruginibacter sp.]|nr:hypothetical protein [Ferruginibacter sp.]